MADNKPQSFDDVLASPGRVLQGAELPAASAAGGGRGAGGGNAVGVRRAAGAAEICDALFRTASRGGAGAGGRLAAKNIPHQISPDGGSLLVPEDKLDASRLETAAAGLPRNARLGFELFDTPNWAGSDFTEKVNYQRALEGELERTLATLSEVEGGAGASGAAAGVAVHRAGARGQGGGDFENPQRALVGAGAAGHSATGGERGRPAASGECHRGRRRQQHSAAARARRAERAFAPDEELAKTLVHTLEPVVGADHVRASVHVEYDLGTSEDTQETYDPKTATALTQEHSEESSTGGAPAGVPGHGEQRAHGDSASGAAGNSRNNPRRNPIRPLTPSARTCIAASNPRDGCGGLRPPCWWMMRWTGHRTGGQAHEHPAQTHGRRNETDRATGAGGDWRGCAARRRAGGGESVLPGAAARNSSAAEQIRTLAAAARALVLGAALCRAGGAVCRGLFPDSASGEEASDRRLPRVAGKDHSA